MKTLNPRDINNIIKQDLIEGLTALHQNPGCIKYVDLDFLRSTFSNFNFNIFYEFSQWDQKRYTIIANNLAKRKISKTNKENIFFQTSIWFLNHKNNVVPEYIDIAAIQFLYALPLIDQNCKHYGYNDRFPYKLMEAINQSVEFVHSNPNENTLPLKWWKILAKTHKPDLLYRGLHCIDAEYVDSSVPNNSVIQLLNTWRKYISLNDLLDVIDFSPIALFMLQAQPQATKDWYKNNTKFQHFRTQIEKLQAVASFYSTVPTSEALQVIQETWQQLKKNNPS